MDGSPPAPEARMLFMPSHVFFIHFLWFSISLLFVD